MSSPSINSAARPLGLFAHELRGFGELALLRATVRRSELPA
jgi:hypothetical protein